MATKNDDEVVEVEDAGQIEVDVTDNPELAAEPEKKATATKEAKKEAKPRVLPDKDDQQVVVQKTTDETAKTALAEAIKKADDAEKAKVAAEATANAERQRAEQAQRLAQQREQEAQGYKEQAEDQQLVNITNGIESATQQVASFQTEFERAAEAGEFKKMAEIQSKLARAAATLDRLEDAKAQLEAAPKQKTTEGRVEAVQTQVPPFEQYLANFSPKAQTWLRNHPDCAPSTVGGDRVKNSKMMAGHYDALAQGLTEGSDDYFRVIEEHAGYRAPVSTASGVKQAGDEADTEDEPVKSTKQKTAQVSAPATNAAPSTVNGQPRTTRSVVLNKEEQEAARISFPQMADKDAFAQYARNKIELEAEGKLGRLTH